MAEHVLDKSKIHNKWDNRIAPALKVEPGDIVHFETDEVTGGQVRPGAPASVLMNLDFDKLYPLGGPIYVKGAAPGDTLEVEILSFKPLEWGWAGLIPGLGLLKDDFTEPYIRYFDLTEGQTTALRDDIRIPIQPFCGTMGVATDDEGPFDVLPPTRGAGNIDTRHLNAGARLHLPVFVEGALFSAGDCHAAQGDGEVCVTGIECPMAFSLRFNVIKGQAIPGFRYRFFTPPGPIQPAYDWAGYYVTTALGPDLFVNAQNAVRDMIEWLGKEKNLSPEDAYILCSVAADLRISQIVDAPNWSVSAYMPLSVFR
ncbi:MAG: acetamidase/formamidase family protein [Chloroflexaceae bacterium]|nr:acetamidase/formamidase family protein [Chloroflexaceae bacterium]NJO04871.1 acetamidase/formamidase family protein [Chloroflexaceae bacterium]NJO83993.1 acetamidase/formamidase family protein [Blastochloris sp.]